MSENDYIQNEQIGGVSSGGSARVASSRKNDDSMNIYDWAQALTYAIAVGILLFVFLFRIVGVDGTSMFSTLYNGDRIFISNLFYEPENGDVIVLRSDSYGSEPLVKRIIATEGQTIDIDFNKGVVYLNGVELHEDYVYTPTNAQEDFSGPVTVPEGYVFVMGDNRNGSTDSRSKHVGLIDKDNILGKAYFILFPGKDTITESRDFKRIGMVR